MNRCSRLWLVASLALGLCVLGGCSNKSDSGPSGSAGSSGSPPPAAQLIVHTGFGEGPGDFGHSVPEDGAPEGPSALTVDAQGQMYVLDQVNGRIQVYKDKKLQSTIPLPNGVYEDVDFDSSGGLVLLDRFDRVALVFIDMQGKEKSAVPLMTDEVPEPGMITALFGRADGAWVEVDEADLVRMTVQGDAADTEHQVAAGRLSPTGDFVIHPELDPVGGSLTLYKQAYPSGSPEEFALPKTDVPVSGVMGLEIDSQGRVYIALNLEAEAQEGAPPPMQRLLIAYDKDGKELGRQSLPADDGPEEVFRPLRLGRDGNLYLLRCTSQGVEISKVTL